MIVAVSNTNVLRAQFALNRNLKELYSSLTKLSTGQRINSGKDDPAGLISAEQLKTELAVLEAESRSLERADRQANITEGHGSQASALLTELNGLVVAGSNTAGMSQAEIDAIQMQIDNTVAGVERISGDTRTALGGLALPGNGNADIGALLDDVSSGLRSITSSGANSLASGNFDAAQAVVKTATQNVATARGILGAYQKYTIAPTLHANAVARENLSASLSRIVDTDYAQETSNLTRRQILTQSTVQVLKAAREEHARVIDLLAPLNT